MYKVLTKNANGASMTEAISATQNFNDSLAYQWMTTDVLTKTLGDYADETTEIGKKAFAAAQDVKTFSQLMDTLKEAVGSGWAETWEIIFGNYDEAKQLWTNISNAVGGFIDSKSKARNAILQEWKDLGGRTDLIESLKNVFVSIEDVTKPIAQGFKEIFGFISGSQISEYTKSFRELTENFKISDKTVENLKNTFKGLFAVLDIGKQLVSAVISGVASFLGIIPGLSDGILGITGSCGKWIVALDENLKKHEIFKKTISGVVEVIELLKNKFQECFKAITGMSIGDAFDLISEKISRAYLKNKKCRNDRDVVY
jgi:hypothetical protein